MVPLMDQPSTVPPFSCSTANLFSHHRFHSGAATNPQAEIFAYGASQVRSCPRQRKEERVARPGISIRRPQSEHMHLERLTDHE